MTKVQIEFTQIKNLDDLTDVVRKIESFGFNGSAEVDSPLAGDGGRLSITADLEEVEF